MSAYRIPLTRWSCAITGAYLAYALSPWGPAQWRDTPSLRWLHQVLPWIALTVLFGLYTVLLAWGRLRAVIVADGIGAVLYGWELIALAVTTRTDSPTNPLAIAAVLLAMVLHIAAARLAIMAVVRRDR